MKKLLALVLALIMVLGLGVTAFADTINVITLDKEVEEDDELEEITLFEAETKKDNEYTFIVREGGDYYIEIDKSNLKDITVTATGSVTAEIVKFDPEEMKYKESFDYRNNSYNPLKVHFDIVDDKGTALPQNSVFNDIHFEDNKLKESGNQFTFNEKAPAFNNADVVKETTIKLILGDSNYETVTKDLVVGTYDWADAVAGALNKVFKISRFSVVAYEENDGTYAKLNKDLLKITVADNYTAAYKEGTVKVAAYNKDTKKNVVANLTIISDVSIFEYEQVKWAVKDGEDLLTSDGGYSDYWTAKLGYSEALEKYNAGKLRKYPLATVVSTTAFRAIEGEDLTVAADKYNYVEIEDIAKGQKGVNFAWENYKYYDEDDEEITDGTKLKGNVEYVTFGFLGNQVINSDFTITVAPQITYYQLRELFGKKVEEEDIITYYVLKDGVKIDEFTVDYANDDIDDPIEIEILGKAGDKLGFYTLTLDAPAAEEGEENPNTGAESVVGVVAAMAVISLATAAAVSLKK